MAWSWSLSPSLDPPRVSVRRPRYVARVDWGCPGGGRGIGADYDGTEPGQPTPEAALAAFLAAHHDSLPADGYVTDPNGAVVIPPSSLADEPSPTEVPKLTYVHRSSGRVDVVVSVGSANPGWNVQTVIAGAS